MYYFAGLCIEKAPETSGRAINVVCRDETGDLKESDEDEDREEDGAFRKHEGR